MKTTVILALALLLAGPAACEFGTGYEEQGLNSVTGRISWDQDEMDKTDPAIDLHSGPAQSDGSGDRTNRRRRPQTPYPGDCLDISTGVPMIVPCMSGGPQTGDTSHGDPQPWHPGTPATVPQPY